MNIDLEALKQGLSVANSAVRVSAIAEETERNQRILDQINKQTARRDATLVAGAEADRNASYAKRYSLCQLCQIEGII